MDKDVLALKALTSSTENILPLIRKRRTGVEDVNIFKATRKTKITFCLVGMWTVSMPPYNLARLTAVTKSAGYSTKILDFNLDSFLRMKVKNPELAKTFNPSLSWSWTTKETYQERIFPDLKEFLDEYIDTLASSESDIIGFSVYMTNVYATNYVANGLREKNPNITIIFGGPQCHEKPPVEYIPPSFVDYYFVGESEQNILDFLEKYENNDLPTEKKIGSLFSDKRISLESLPFPDYSDLDLSNYDTNDSVVAEFSRGCVARCTYCSEVYYWKFRDRYAKNMVDELEYLKNKYQTRFVYFADSLMNGNLKEFKDFCQELADRDLDISWWGYARADGRMDLEFFELIKKAGGLGFNFGFESGSDKVLKAINKKNTVAEINQNLIDCKKAGVQVSALMIFGAPGEDIEAFNHTVNLLWNHKDKIPFASIGSGLHDVPGTAYDDRKRFNISDRGKDWMGRWYTLDFENTGVHRFIRAKLLCILLDISNKIPGISINNTNYIIDDMSKHYSVNFINESADRYIENEFDFNYKVIKSDLSPFANSLMNEPFALLRALWKAKGAYEIYIKFNTEIDEKDFEQVKPLKWFDYFAKIHFKIDDNGFFDIRCNHNFKDHQKYRFKNGSDELEKIDESFYYTHTSSGQWK